MCLYNHIGIGTPPPLLFIVQVHKTPKLVDDISGVGNGVPISKRGQVGVGKSTEN